MPKLADRHPLEVVLADDCPSQTCDLDQAFVRCEPQPNQEQRSAGLARRLTPAELAAEYRRWVAETAPRRWL